ncbi:MAG: hypothetical protein ACR2OW_08295 [Methyloligellaceae bacterium]
MKQESVESATALLNDLKPQIMSLPGILNFINVMNKDGSGYVISVVESEEISNANQDKVQAIWAQFADYLAEPPVIEGFDVLMNESN